MIARVQPVLWPWLSFNLGVMRITLIYRVEAPNFQPNLITDERIERITCMIDRKFNPPPRGTGPSKWRRAQCGSQRARTPLRPRRAVFPSWSSGRTLRPAPPWSLPDERRAGHPSQFLPYPGGRSGGAIGRRSSCPSGTGQRFPDSIGRRRPRARSGRAIPTAPQQCGPAATAAAFLGPRQKLRLQRDPHEFTWDASPPNSVTKPAKHYTSTREPQFEFNC